MGRSKCLPPLRPLAGSPEGDRQDGAAIGGAEGAGQGATSWRSPAQHRGILSVPRGKTGRQADENGTPGQWRPQRAPWLWPLLAQTLSTAQEHSERGFRSLVH